VKSIILSGEFGSSLLERGLSWQAKAIFPYLERAVCYYGTCEFIPAKIHVDAFGGDQPPHAPSITELEDAICEMEKVGVIERWTDDNSRKWLFITRWFNDNYLKTTTKPRGPRPPSLSRSVTIADWQAGNCAKLFNKFKNIQNNSEEIPLISKKYEGNKKEVILRVFNRYREKIQPRITPLKEHLAAIAKALDNFSVDQLVQAIDNREHDEFFWKGGNGYRPNCTRGAAWFFGNQPRLERFINDKPSKKKPDPRRAIAEEE